MDWINRYTGTRYPVTTRRTPFALMAHVKSYGKVYRDYVRHPEWKSAGPEGQPCGRQTRGLLQRRHVRPLGVQMIGKESNRLEEVQQGLIADRDEVLENYGRGEEGLWEAVRNVMGDLSRKELARRSGLTPKTLDRIRRGEVQNPHDETRRKLLVGVKQMLSG